MKRESLLELGRKLLWDKWQNSSDELASVAIASLMDAGMLVEPGGAADLRTRPHVEDVTVTCTETHTCSHCGYGWEVLTADEAADASTNQDEHSVEGEPVCCEAAIGEFRAERGIPLLDESGAR